MSARDIAKIENTSIVQSEEIYHPNSKTVIWGISQLLIVSHQQGESLLTPIDLTLGASRSVTYSPLYICLTINMNPGRL